MGDINPIKLHQAKRKCYPDHMSLTTSIKIRHCRQIGPSLSSIKYYYCGVLDFGFDDI